jgi:hypothetical protein
VTAAIVALLKIPALNIHTTPGGKTR